MTEPTKYGMPAHRRTLALALLDAGWSERKVGALAGVSGPAVHGWKKERTA